MYALGLCVLLGYIGLCYVCSVSYSEWKFDSPQLIMWKFVMGLALQSSNIVSISMQDDMHDHECDGKTKIQFCKLVSTFKCAIYNQRHLQAVE